MLDAIVKLKDIVDRDVDGREAEDVVDYLLACLTHITNARPLFGVLNTSTDELEWTAGGAAFHEVLQHMERARGAGSDTMSMAQLFACFEISNDDWALVLQQMQGLNPGAALTMLYPMKGRGGLSFRMMLRRRHEPHGAQVQFSILDVTPFEATAQRTQDMARTLLADLAQPVENGLGASDLLLSVVDGLDDLFDLDSDLRIAAMAQTLSARVTSVATRMVTMLQEFEGRFDTSHWQPDDLNPSLRPIIPVHSAPVDAWTDHHGTVMTEVDGLPAVQGLDVFSLKQSYDFVQNAASTLVMSPRGGCIFVLNGPAGWRKISTVDDLVRALEVEENSTRTAVDFFSTLADKPSLGLFAMAGQNVEAWGRPGLYGGWQAMLAPSTSHSVDVRGLFHGLKNLLLHLQVLYVVNTKADVEQVREALGDAGHKIRDRLQDLDNISRTGRRNVALVKESVGQWLASVQRMNLSRGNALRVEAGGLDDISFMSPPGDMEDALQELVRNAFQHGARQVSIDSMTRGDHFCINIIDDGRGMTDEKLRQVRHVLSSRDYDATLSTRKDGTGNGLLAASIVVSHFVDGRLEVNPGPLGQGVEIQISMKLPA